MRKALLALAFHMSAVAMLNAQITLFSDFDHGSLKSWSNDGQQLNLVGRDNYYGGEQWRWLYFRADGVVGHRPTFRISSNFAGGSQRLTNHET